MRDSIVMMLLLVAMIGITAVVLASGISGWLFVVCASLVGVAVAAILITYDLRR